MPFRAQTGAIKLLAKVFDEQTPTQALIDAPAHKPRYRYIPGTVHLPRALPESVGIPSGYLEDMVRELRAAKTLDMHGITVARHGQVVMEADFGAYSRQVWHTTYSICKTVVGMAVGMLWDEGKLDLDAKVHSFFPGRGGALAALALGGLTVRHLLTMRSGVLFNEAGSLTNEDWVKGFLESMTKFEPGTQFEYNSMNSYMLAALVTTLAGTSVMQYLKPRLFEPLGIANVYWATCPMGIEKGGWGMYMLPEDQLKLAQLLLDGGMWEGKRLLSAEWIDMAVQPHSPAPDRMGSYDYGFHIWVGRKQRIWLLNGMFGQNAFVYPDQQLVIVTSAANSEGFQQGAMFEIIEKYFANDDAFGDALPKDDAAYESLSIALEDIRHPIQPSSLPVSALYNHLGVYRTGEKHAASVSLLPLIEQAVQNSFASGLHSILLKKTEDCMVLSFYEGEKRCDLPIDLDEARNIDVLLCGQPYCVAVTSVLTTDEDDHVVLKIRLSFQEIPNVRFIKLYFLGDSLHVKMRELPGKDCVMGSIESFFDQISSTGKYLLGPLTSRLEGDYIAYKIDRAFEPAVLFDKSI